MPNQDNNHIQTSALPQNPVVGMAYIPYQNPENVYSAEQGIAVGTLFPDLDKPFKECEGDSK